LIYHFVEEVNMSLKRLSFRIYFIIAALLSPQLFASGFFIIEQGVEGFKTGYAGAATAIESPETVFFNPAVMDRLEGYQVSSGFHVLVPNNKFTNNGSTIKGAKMTGTSGGNPAENAVVPHFYTTYKVNDRLTLGLGVFPPFGLTTIYPKKWVGRYHALKSEMTTININPCFSYKVRDWFTLAFGASTQYVSAELTSAVDFGGLGTLPFGTAPQSDDGRVDIDVKDWGYGFNLGALFEPIKDFRIGLTFRSSIATNLTGTASFKRSATGDRIKNATGAFTNTEARSNLHLPEMASIGLYYRLNPEWEVMGDVMYTNWHRLKELRVRFRNAIQPDDVSHMNWKAVGRYAVGTRYTPIEKLTLGLGFGFDQSPIQKQFRTPRVPDSNRYFIQTGITYRAADWLALDCGYGHIFFKNSTVNLNEKNKGNLVGSFKSRVDIFNAQARITI
jgi:long-chain fatty acid transport protein